MDINLPEELQVLEDTVRKFVDRELIPSECENCLEGEDMPERLQAAPGKSAGHWPVAARCAAGARQRGSRSPQGVCSRRNPHSIFSAYSEPPRWLHGSLKTSCARLLVRHLRLDVEKAVGVHRGHNLGA